MFAFELTCLLQSKEVFGKSKEVLDQG